MDVDPAAREFAAAVSRPDGQIDLTRAALIIAKSEYSTLDVQAYLDRLDALARRARTSRAIDYPFVTMRPGASLLTGPRSRWP